MGLSHATNEQNQRSKLIRDTKSRHPKWRMTKTRNKMIKNIVFDFGGVLVQYDYIAYFTEYFHSEEKARHFFEQVLPKSFNNEVDRALHPFSYYIERQKRQWPEYAEAIDHFDHHFADFFTGETVGMYEWMCQLKSEGYRLLGLSNWSTKVHDVIARFPRVFEPLEDCLISYSCHLLKPERDIYELFCKKFSVRPEECVFIDDRPANIEGAREAGMHGIVFKDMDQLKRDMNDLLHGLPEQ